MKIQELILYTNSISKQKEFYTKKLGFNLLEEKENKFSIQIGYTKLIFEYSECDYKYHYCFLIPSNKLNEAVNWLKKRLEIVKIEAKFETQFFESWNAESVYFYDGTGNITEFIVRYDLENAVNEEFNNTQIISVNEIGAPSKTIKKHDKLLEDSIHSKLWKGSYERFACNGTQDGLFLLVNKEEKKTWFPTKVKTESAPFKAVILNNKKQYNVTFKDEEFKVEHLL